MVAYAQSAVLCFVIFLAGPSPSFGNASNTQGGELAIINADRVNLRTHPSSSSPIKGQLRFGSWVRASQNREKADGLSWLQVVRNECLDEACSVDRRAGWVAEEYVSLTSKFERPTSWKESYLTIGAGDYQGYFHFRSNGTFEHRHIPCVDGNCGENREHDVCHPSEVRRGQYCVSEGVMLRRGRLVVLRFNGASEPSDWLYLNGDQLCHGSYTLGDPAVCSNSSPNEAFQPTR